MKLKIEILGCDAMCALPGQWEGVGNSLEDLWSHNALMKDSTALKWCLETYRDLYIRFPSAVTHGQTVPHKNHPPVHKQTH